MRSQNIQSDRLVNWIKKYDKIMFIISITAGFYAAIELFTSRIFPKTIFYFPLKPDEKEVLKHYKFINIVLLENIPR